MEWLLLTLAIAIAFLLGFVLAFYINRGALDSAKRFFEEAQGLKAAADTVHAGTLAALEQAMCLLRTAQELDNQTMNRLRGGT